MQRHYLLQAGAAQTKLYYKLILLSKWLNTFFINDEIVNFFFFIQDRGIIFKAVFICCINIWCMSFHLLLQSLFLKTFIQREWQLHGVFCI
jgi:hypothetical protein